MIVFNKRWCFVCLIVDDYDNNDTHDDDEDGDAADDDDTDGNSDGDSDGDSVGVGDGDGDDDYVMNTERQTVSLDVGGEDDGLFHADVEEFLGMGETEGAEPAVQEATKSTSLKHVDYSVLEHQNKLEDYYKPKTLDSIRTYDRRSKDGGGSIDPRDMIALNHFRLDAKLSVKQGNKLLKFMENLHKRHGVDIHFPVSGIRTVDSSVNRDFKTLKTIREFVYPYPSRYFGEMEKPAAVAVCYDIKEVMAEVFLGVTNIGNVFLTPDVRLRDQDRIFEDYTTSEHYVRLSAAVKESFGDDAVAISIGVSLDKARLSGSKRNACPLVVYFPNLINDEFKIFLLGYVPTKFSCSNKQLDRILDERGCKTKKQRKTILQMLQRNLEHKFIFQALEPLLALGKLTTTTT